MFGAAATEIAQKKDIAVRFIDVAEPMWVTADGDRLQQVYGTWSRLSLEETYARCARARP